ncbi:DsbA family protein [Aurantimonas sp. Leaf443]|uniref:DsbA family protein n=1 Tax=Aurantimonas sp. Leaf443 TaxID=1736378 RepID=UPI0006F92610|nr:DsbA family protein [Aurantimonas sp. Leaf443]KQT83423.1 disulfide bond formation protein DsbA [Aurantimonas sp. Leaf443]
MVLRPLLLAAALLGGTAGTNAQQTSFDETQARDIRAIVRDYLVANPEVLVEAMTALEAKQSAQQAAAQSKAVASIASSLHASPEGTVIGNPDGDVTVVEFFDYNCGYCRHAMADMDAMVKADPKLRFVLKEIPVLGPNSAEASHVSLAFRQIAPAKYPAYHRALLGAPGVSNEAKALGVAEELGVSEAEIRKAMQSSAVMDALAESNAMASVLQLTGTPTYVIGDEVISGAVGKEQLAARVASLRECGKTAC